MTKSGTLSIMAKTLTMLSVNGDYLSLFFRMYFNLFSKPHLNHGIFLYDRSHGNQGLCLEPDPLAHAYFMKVWDGYYFWTVTICWLVTSCQLGQQERDQVWTSYGWAKHGRRRTLPHPWITPYSHVSIYSATSPVPSLYPGIKYVHHILDVSLNTTKIVTPGLRRKYICSQMLPLYFMSAKKAM